MFMISQCGLRIFGRKKQVTPNNIEHIYFGGYCLLKFFPEKSRCHLHIGLN